MRESDPHFTNYFRMGMLITNRIKEYFINFCLAPWPEAAAAAAAAGSARRGWLGSPAGPTALACRRCLPSNGSNGKGNQL